MTRMPIPIYVGEYGPMRSGDVRDLYMDVAADLDSGETIASVTFSVTDADGAAVADVVTAHTESVSRTDFRVEAPAAGTYTLTAVFTHTDGQVVTHTARLIVA